MYIPNPVDTSNIHLSSELLDLMEKIAENVHDHWAVERFAQGWTYGATRNDTLKTHPCLIPYDSLPESEKVFDRNTALETLKLITALGYRIEKI